jgi:hypothetical protein
MCNWLGEPDTGPELILASDLCNNKLKIVFPHAVYYETENINWWSIIDTSARIDNITCNNYECTFCHNFMRGAVLKFKKYQKILDHFKKHL